MCYCGNTGVERIPKLESAQKADPGEETSPPFLQGFEPDAHESDALTTGLSPPPVTCGLSFISVQMAGAHWLVHAVHPFRI